METDDIDSRTMPGGADTICAVATPTGVGGIAVVRVSGADAVGVVARLWHGAPLATMASHTVHLGTVADSDGTPVDQVVLTLYRAPHSYTGEDVVELSCHGSAYIQRRLVEALTGAGARMATRGEFTRRAFLNGRLDLSQAEAVADVIAAESAAAHRVALNQLRGAMSTRLRELHDRLVHFTALLELELDFAEEDVEFADRHELLSLATTMEAELAALAATFSDGNAIRHGVPLAIVGATNAGKSTLLNALLGDQRAIVSDVHGTTRDTIEETLTVGGTLLRLVDTAGLRDTGDSVEAMGIRRSLDAMERARVVLWVVDATMPPAAVDALAGDVLPRSHDKTLIVVINKTDAASAAPLEARLAALPLPEGAVTLAMSAHDDGDIERLRQTIGSAAVPRVALDADALVVTNARHHEALTHALTALRRAIAALRDGVSGEFVAQDLQEVRLHLGSITGAITTDAVLHDIFDHFCIGK